MTDNVAVLAGFTKELRAIGGEFDLALLVRPDAELDGAFMAWDMEEQEFITVNGWLFNLAEGEGS